MVQFRLLAWSAALVVAAMVGGAAQAANYQAYFIDGVNNKEALYHQSSTCNRYNTEGCVEFGTVCNQTYYSSPSTLDEAHSIINGGGTLYIRDAGTGKVICKVS